MEESTAYRDAARDRASIDRGRGPALLVFGTNWCGHCRAAAPAIDAALAGHPRVAVDRVEDGPGRRLGRTFGVKLWPTLIFLRDGQEVTRLVRPREAQPIAQALAAIDPPAGPASVQTTG
jgi:thioredoxin 1